MSSEINNFVKTCTTCQKYAKNNPKQPLKLYTIPLYPWQQVAVDIATFQKHDYLVIVDKYSNWPEVVQLSSESASEVALHLQNAFARHGIPETVISDNNPFNSVTFNDFAKEWGFQTVFTSTHFPQSNGHVERTVQMVKSLLKKCVEENASLQYAFLQDRNTPLPDIGCSPAQAVMERRLRTKLPIASDLLAPKTVPSEAVIQCKEKSQDVQKFYFDQSAEELEPVHQGQLVCVKDNLTDMH